MSQQPPRTATPKSGPEFANSKTKVNAIVTGTVGPAGNVTRSPAMPREESAKLRDSTAKNAKTPPVAPTKG